MKPSPPWAWPARPWPATGRPELTGLLLRLQRELFVVGAELATHVEKRAKLTDGTSRVTAEMVTWLEGEIDQIEAGHPMPAEFVIPGESLAGAAIDLARTTVRRAERRAVALATPAASPTRRSCPT